MCEPQKGWVVPDTVKVAVARELRSVVEFTGYGSVEIEVEDGRVRGIRARHRRVVTEEVSSGYQPVSDP